jgi:hypothetical protein
MLSLSTSQSGDGRLSCLPCGIPTAVAPPGTVLRETLVLGLTRLRMAYKAGSLSLLQGDRLVWELISCLEKIDNADR